MYQIEIFYFKKLILILSKVVFGIIFFLNKFNLCYSYLSNASSKALKLCDIGMDLFLLKVKVRSIYI